MRKIILILIIFIPISANSQWFWQNPLPQGNKIQALKFVTSALGYAATEAGTIMKTLDGGATWTITANNLGIDFTGIDFVNALTGIAVGGIGATGYFARTTDGGITWSSQSGGQFNGLTCVTLVNANTGFAGAFSGIIFVTTNSGINWSIQNSNMTAIRGIYFVNANTGFAVTSNMIYKTSNGGINWIVMYTSQTAGLNSITFRDVSTGIACGGMGRVLRTTNSGNNWDSIYSGVNAILNSTCFMNQNTVFAAGGWYTLFTSAIIRSTNSGLNWVLQESGTKDELIVIAKRDSLAAFIAGAYGRILKYNYSGSNWVSISSGFPGGMTDIALINSNVVYAIGGGGSGLDQYGRFIKTTNGGLNWNIYTINTMNRLTAISFIDANTGWTVGDYLPVNQSAIYRTTNGGLNWTSQSQYWSPPVFLNDVFFLNANTGTVIGIGQGAGARIYKTTDGGLSWVQQNSPITFALYRMYYVNLNTGFIGSDGFILKTTNGGNLWSAWPTLPGIYIVRDLFFLNESTGWAVGNRVYKTTNSGGNWTQQFIPGNTTNSVHFINANTGYISCADGLIYSTSNGGISWFPQISGTRRWLTGIRFADQYSGWIVGYDGVILHTTNGGFVNIASISKSVPQNFSLSQNYPNPFNPVTKIKFQIPLSRGVSEGRGVLVQLVIYDVLGREIRTLVNEHLQPGTYEVEWDASAYPSGVYFYQLSINNEQLATRKMVLVK